jgi:hypothetical protein
MDEVALKRKNKMAKRWLLSLVALVVAFTITTLECRNLPPNWEIKTVLWTLSLFSKQPEGLRPATEPTPEWHFLKHNNNFKL